MNALPATQHQTTQVQRSISGPPPAIDRVQRDAIAIFQNNVVADGSGYRFLAASREPDTRAMAWLSGRHELVAASLAHRDPDGVNRALLTMFAVMKIPAGSEADAETMAGVYAATLSDLPGWAIIEACEGVVRGRAINKTFAPTSPELRDIAARILAPVYRERGQLKAILTAKPAVQAPTPEQRARVEALAAEFRGSIKAMPGSEAPSP